MSIGRRTWIEKVARRFGLRWIGKHRTTRRPHKVHLSVEALEARQMMAADVSLTGAAWQNAADPLDVNNDGYITPLDAVVIVGDLRNNGPRALPESRDVGAPYLDVDGDQSVSATDFNWVADHLQSLAQLSPSGASGPTNEFGPEGGISFYTAACGGPGF